MIKTFIACISVCLACSLSLQAQSDAIPGMNKDSLKLELEKQKAANKAQAANTQFRYFVTKAAAGTFGYDIYANGKLYIHQQTIPGATGVHGFADTSAAGRTARFAIDKILKGEIPPTISAEELEKLKVPVQK